VKPRPETDSARAARNPKRKAVGTRRKEGQTACERKASKIKSQKTSKIQIVNFKPAGRGG
jgi:hypothetical protein